MRVRIIECGITPETEHRGEPAIHADNSGYLDKHGWHFSEKLFDHAVSYMKYPEGEKATKGHVDTLLKANGIHIDNDHGYDAAYVYNMAKSDFFGTSISDEKALLSYVKDYLDDQDGYEGVALRRYLADCEGRGYTIDLEEYI